MIHPSDIPFGQPLWQAAALLLIAGLTRTWWQRKTDRKPAEIPVERKRPDRSRT